MGRATSGVLGMRFTDDDELLAMEVVRDEGVEVLVATEGGYAKRTGIEEYPRPGPRRQGRADGAYRVHPRRAGRRARRPPGGRDLRDHVRRRRDPDRRPRRSGGPSARRWACG